MTLTPSSPFSDTDQKCISTIRSLSIDAIEKANSGHPGLPLGAAPMAYVLWQRHYKHCPSTPSWPDRDRFVLSAGHGSMLHYSLLHLTGYDLPLDEIKNFRQWGSKTPGHPEYHLTAGVEATTGPLGQGSANVVGMAIAERRLAQLFNRPGFEIVNHYTYGLVSDGDLMEGVSAEAASLAGHLKLGKLIYLYDSNDITLDGPTSLTFSTENLAKRYESYGWQVLTVQNGDEDLDSLDKAITEAKSDSSRPSIIIVKTTIGFHSPIAGTSKVHGSPLKGEDTKSTKRSMGMDPDATFEIPEGVKDHFQSGIEKNKNEFNRWNALFTEYREKHPELAQEWENAQKGILPSGWDSELPTFESGKSLATRKASGAALNAIAKKVSWLIGGDADLSCSTGTLIQDGGSFEGQEGAGRNIHYGVREHAMTAIANGIAYHGGLLPFVATFFCFADYMRPSIRLAALNELPSIYVWTHDSIGLGEDGPTHQPVEHLMSLRVMPNMTLIRPCDANEAVTAWKMAVQHRSGPVGLVFTRQDLPILDRSQSASAEQAEKGAYILKDSSNGKPELILMASGSEVHLALEAQSALEEKSGIPTRVVSFPCWEYFQKQSKEYREEVLPPSIKNRMGIEAGSSLGWEKWVGLEGRILGIDQFGASAPADILFEKYGFTVEKVVQEALQMVKKG